MKKRKTMRDAMILDGRIKAIAAYELTEGVGPSISMAKDMDEIISFNNQIEEKFKEYKELIRSGKFTIDQLEERVVEEYGAFTKSENEFNLENIEDTPDEVLHGFLDDLDEKDAQKESEKQLEKIIDNIFGPSALLPPMSHDVMGEPKEDLEDRPPIDLKFYEIKDPKGPLFEQMPSDVKKHANDNFMNLIEEEPIKKKSNKSKKKEEKIGVKEKISRIIHLILDSILGKLENAPKKDKSISE